MARVLGIGGFFFHCRDVEATRNWYAEVLGFEIDGNGGKMFAYREALDEFGDGALTVWAPFSGNSDYFAPSTQNHMINFIVDDLEGVLARAARHGVEPVKPREDYDYGSFAWIMDPDGRKLELWQPKGAPGGQ